MILEKTNQITFNGVIFRRLSVSYHDLHTLFSFKPPPSVILLTVVHQVSQLLDHSQVPRHSVNTIGVQSCSMKRKKEVHFERRLNIDTDKDSIFISWTS